MISYNYLLFFVAHDLHRSRRFPSHFTCLSDNMFGLIAGSDIKRIPSAGTPLLRDVNGVLPIAPDGGSKLVGSDPVRPKSARATNSLFLCQLVTLVG